MRRGRWTRWALSVCALAAGLAGGCARTPAGAIVLADHVQTGVVRMHEDARRMATALAQTQRVALDERWEADYARAEAMYLQREGIGAPALTQSHRAAIAAIAAAVRERSLASIGQKERELVEAMRANRDRVLLLHEALTAHLHSLRAAQRTREAIVTKLDRWTGWDIAPALLDLEQAIAQLEEDAQGRE